MKLGIVGYGNLGKSVEKMLAFDKNHSLFGIFSRRGKSQINAKTDRVYPQSALFENKIELDALILCVGSHTDLLDIAPCLAKKYNTVDSYDNHSRMKDYLSIMDKCAREGKNLSISACGWDPGFLSAVRLYFSLFFSREKTYTFWGRGVSLGHSEAIRSLSGVKYAVCYTVPYENSIDLASSGDLLSKSSLHRRECFVVADGNTLELAEQIKSIPDYFLGTKTDVYFIKEEEFFKYHTGTNHRARLISGDADGTRARLEVNITKNPDFTAKIMLSYLTALEKLKADGTVGVKTPLDIPLSCLVDDIYKYI